MNKVYFAGSEALFTLRYQEHLRVAVVSARKVGLEPRLIYDGNEHQELQILERLGATIIRHQVSFLSALEKSAPSRFPLHVARGAYLRFEVPNIELEDEFAVYCDVDVMFTRPLRLDAVRPPYFACTSEMGFEHFAHFNSGVMVMNVKTMRESYDALCRFAVERKFDYGSQDPYDQTCLNVFYKGRWNTLDQSYNWKPYWGINPWAPIVHWHGVKYHAAKHMLSPETFPKPDYMIHEEIFQKAPEAYAYYAAVFDAHNNAVF